MWYIRNTEQGASTNRNIIKSVVVTWDLSLVDGSGAGRNVFTWERPMQTRGKNTMDLLRSLSKNPHGTTISHN